MALLNWNASPIDPRFDELWDKVESLQQKGQPRATLPILDEIVDLANDKQAYPQWIKALQYKANAMTELEESGAIKAIDMLEVHLSSANVEVRPLLEATIARRMKQYLASNAYKMSNRTTVNDDLPEDKERWSPTDFERKTLAYYMSALEHARANKRIEIGRYAAIIENGENTLHLIPTVYEFIAHEVLDYLAHEAGNHSFKGITEPVNWADYLVPVNDFLKLVIDDKNPSDYDRKELVVYQQLLDYQSSQKNKDPFLFSELKRLERIAGNGGDSEQETYKTALEHLSTKYVKATEWPLVQQRLAQYYQQQAQKSTTKAEKAAANKKAYEILKNAVANAEKSYGQQQCAYQMKSMESPSLQVQFDQNWIPFQPSMLQINYKNIDGVTWTIGKMSKENFIRYHQDYKYRNNHRAVLRNANTIKSDQVDLVDKNDFTEYSKIIFEDGLAPGAYCVLAENKNKNIESFFVFQVTSLSYVHQYGESVDNKLIVINRKTGEPEANATVELFARSGYGRNEASTTPAITGVTDANGVYVLNKMQERSYRVEISKGDDHYIPMDYVHANRFGERNGRTQASIFTDRAIYRPGQKVMYKVVLYNQDADGMPSLATNQEIQIDYLDANYQVVHTVTKTTNDFGSVAGEFIAPVSGLNGGHQIRVNGFGQQYIRVEEYKRPKFNVELTIPNNAIVMGEEISVPGLVKLFAGPAVENAKVNYTVTRDVQYHYFWYWGGYGGGDNRTLIATGNTTTDVDGKFDVPFTALADKTVNTRWAPIYVYTIKADVTDINGETRSGTITLRVGDQPYYISTDIAGQVDQEVFKGFTLSSKNAMNQPSPASVKVEVHQLLAPTDYRLRPNWKDIDYPLSSDEKAKFPWIDFDNAWDYENWKQGDLVFSDNIEVNGDKKIPFTDRLPVGVYRIVVKDNQGQEKYKAVFNCYSSREKKIINNELFSALVDKQAYAPGDEAHVLLHSPMAGTKVLVQVEKNKRLISERWYTLNETTEISIPVTEKDRGGFVVRTTFVYQNRADTRTIPIHVPWSNKNLSISWETFRNKLLPGQKETWRLKIEGADKEAVAAELLASMYDASLDEFVPHGYSFSLYPTFVGRFWSTISGFGTSNSHGRYDQTIAYPDIQRVFPTWRYIQYYHMYYGGMQLKKESMPQAEMAAGRPSMKKSRTMSAPMMDDEAENAVMDAQEESISSPPANTDDGSSDVKSFAPRKNLNETVFFMPQLRTDAEGNVVLEFTMNEALTAWKLQLLAHTKELAVGVKTEEILTQKDLMVFPQLPRFIREGDNITISAKVNKLVEKAIQGKAWIDILDAETGQSYTNTLVTNASRQFDLSDKKSASVDFDVAIPAGFIRPLEFIIRAKAGKHTDGESNIVPVLTNSMLITETIPMSVRAGQKRTFDFKALRNMQDKGVRPHQLTLEYMENPVWFAVQSLPYLTEYPHKCTEQIAHKIYANAIASHIVKQYPKIQEIFNEWDSKDELISNLNKNQELKSALIEETPWLRDAQSEEEQMKNIALLFDFTRMSNELAENIDILLQRQRGNGAFSWFTGGRDNVYITQLVVEIVGHLEFLGIDLPRNSEIQAMVGRAIEFSFHEMRQRYERLPKNAKKAPIIDQTSLHAIYVASFYPKMSSRDFTAWDYYYKNAKEKWVDLSLYGQSMLAAACFRLEDKGISQDIVASFKDRALRSEELGMYYKYNRGYYWYNQPIETQAHVMEAISLVDESNDDLNEMRIWLLKQKQTNRWSSTMSTAKAIYALLLRGDDWLGETEAPYIKVGSEIVSEPSMKLDDKMAGTGYIKRTWEAKEVTQAMHEVVIENPNQVISWGAAYWQYFQPIDKVERYDDNPLSVKRSVFKKVVTNQGERLEPIDGADVAVGDKVTIRLEIKVDRMMEFIHLKDLRGAGFEPIDVLSQYNWEGGLGYYQSTTDLGTHFFIDYVQQGTYVLEYDVFAANAGDFSGGLATLQCMYAPEFASHSEGSRFTIKR